MPTYYVDSVSGSNTSPYDTWAKAATALSTIAAIDVAGDTIYVAHNHSEPGLSSPNYAFAGSITSPVKILCVTSGTTTLATGASLSATGTFTINGSIYVYGVKFITTGGLAFGTNAVQKQVYQNCEIHWGSSTSVLGPAGVANVPVEVVFENCGFKTTATGAAYQVACTNIISGGSVLSGASGTVPMWTTGGDRTHSVLTVSGFDMSNVSSSSAAIFTDGGASAGAMWTIRNCKLKASFSGSLVSGTVSNGCYYSMINCDDADPDTASAQYRHASAHGTITQDSTVYLTAGVTDGVLPQSYKFVTHATNCNIYTGRFYGPEFHVWNDTTGSSKTATVQIVHNSQGSGTDGALKDTEIWLEIMYLGTSGYPQGTWKAGQYDGTPIDFINVTGSGTDHSAGDGLGAWTGDSAGWDSQKLTCTFTPQEKGVVVARVVMAVANKTVYVDPNVTIT